jgi:Fe-S cluster assembly protein SufD
VEVLVADTRGPHLQSALTEIVVGEGAEVAHTRLQIGRSDGYTIAGLEVDQRRSSRFTSHLFTFGGSLTRVDLRVRLAGEGAECSLDGLYAAKGRHQVEHHTRVEHLAPHTASTQLYKGVVDADAQAVFDGTVIVERGAAGTAAHQKNQNLLLSEGASVHSKPHLEIDTDDVTCSHGATVGQLDPNQLFYLRSRGIDRDAARALLVDAFAREMVERIGDEALRGAVARVVQRTEPLAHGEGGLA